MECGDCEQEALKGRGEFPCPVCPVLHLEPLYSENQEALSLYRIVATQVGMDFHLAPVLLDRLFQDRNLEEMVDVMERLDLIYASMRRISEAQQPRA